MKRHWYFYFMGIAAMLVSTFLDMNAPVITGKIIDRVIIGGEVSIFYGLLLTLVGITVGRAIFGYTKELGFDLAGVNIAKSLREELFDHIQSLSQNFFEEKNTGELMSRLKDDADKIWQGISFGIMLVIEMSIYLVLASTFMLLINWKLALLTFLALPIMGYIAMKLESEIDEVYGKISEQNATLNTTAQENIAGVRLVKAFAREKFEIQKFLKQNKGYYDLNMAYAKSIGKRFPGIQMVSNILPIMVVVLGGSFVIGESMTLGTLAKFLGYTYMVVWPMRMIGWLSSIMAEAIGAMKKIDTVFDSKAVIYDKEDAVTMQDEECRGSIRFENVSLTLNQSEILKNISFDVKPGRTLAIMGATGAGKTSIINLLERFYEPTEGEVLFDGYNISNLTLKSLRSKIAVVMQDVFLFSDSIHNNIHFGGEQEISEENIEASAKQAQAHDFIDKMDKKYRTVIGERGIGLSGGQKQRISLARAFAKKAKVIIFDDSTSALDMETEHEIQNEISQLKGVTKIIVAHRISAVKDADEIIILEAGEIVERGTHKELLKLKGRYFETFSEQYEGYIA